MPVLFEGMERQLEKITTEEALKRGLISEKEPVAVISNYGMCAVLENSTLKVDKRDVPEEAVAYVEGKIKVFMGVSYTAIQFYKKQ